MGQLAPVWLSLYLSRIPLDLLGGLPEKMGEVGEKSWWKVSVLI